MCSVVTRIICVILPCVPYVTGVEVGLGPELTMEEAKAILDEIDNKGEGRINFKQFQALLQDNTDRRTSMDRSRSPPLRQPADVPATIKEGVPEQNGALSTPIEAVAATPAAQQ